jgi:hypothetical protein
VRRYHHPDTQEIFPDVMLQNVFSSTMILGEVPQRQPLSEGDPVIFDARSPYITFSVIDPRTGRAVLCGESRPRSRLGQAEQPSAG